MRNHTYRTIQIDQIKISGLWFPAIIKYRTGTEPSCIDATF